MRQRLRIKNDHSHILVTLGREIICIIKEGDAWNFYCALTSNTFESVVGGYFFDHVDIPYLGKYIVAEKVDPITEHFSYRVLKVEEKRMKQLIKLFSKLLKIKEECTIEI